MIILIPYHYHYHQNQYFPNHHTSTHPRNHPTKNMPMNIWTLSFLNNNLYSTSYNWQFETHQLKHDIYNKSHSKAKLVMFRFYVYRLFRYSILFVHRKIYFLLRDSKYKRIIRIVIKQFQRTMRTISEYFIFDFYKFFSSFSWRTACKYR